MTTIGEKVRHAISHCQTTNHARAIVACQALGIDPDAPEGSGRWVPTAEADLADLMEEAFQELADSSPHYVDEYGAAHIVVSYDLIQRCKQAAP